MKEETKPKADQHDHNDHLPKDVLNLEQDPNSFKDPLQQQLERTEQMKKDNTNKNLGGENLDKNS